MSAARPVRAHLLHFTAIAASDRRHCEGEAFSGAPGASSGGEEGEPLDGQEEEQHERSGREQTGRANGVRQPAETDNRSGSTPWSFLRINEHALEERLAIYARLKALRPELEKKSKRLPHTRHCHDEQARGN